MFTMKDLNFFYIETHLSEKSKPMYTKWRKLRTSERNQETYLMGSCWKIEDISLNGSGITTSWWWSTEDDDDDGEEEGGDVTSSKESHSNDDDPLEISETEGDVEEYEEEEEEKDPTTSRTSSWYTWSGSFFWACSIDLQCFVSPALDHKQNLTG